MEPTPAPVTSINSFSAAVFPFQLLQNVLKRLEACEDAETKLLSSEFKQYIENNQPQGINSTRKVPTNFRSVIEASPQPVALLEKPIPSPLLMPAPAIPGGEFWGLFFSKEGPWFFFYMFNFTYTCMNV